MRGRISLINYLLYLVENDEILMIIERISYYGMQVNSTILDTFEGPSSKGKCSLCLILFTWLMISYDLLVFFLLFYRDELISHFFIKGLDINAFQFISRFLGSNAQTWGERMLEMKRAWYATAFHIEVTIDWDVKQSPNFSFNWGLNYEGWDSTDSPESLGDKLVEMPRLRAMRLFKKSRNIQAIIHNSFLRPMILLIPWYRLLMVPFLR